MSEIKKEKFDKEKVGRFVELEGVINWAQIHPHQRNFVGYQGKSLEDVEGEYSADIVLIKKDGTINSELVNRAKEAYLDVKTDKDGNPVIKARREHSRVRKVDGERIVKGPPKVYYSAKPGDGCLTPLPETIMIGNGSYGNVSVFAKIYTSEEVKRKKARAILQGIQLTDLKIYVDSGSQGKSGFRPVEGTATPSPDTTTEKPIIDDELPF